MHRPHSYVGRCVVRDRGRELAGDGRIEVTRGSQFDVGAVVLSALPVLMMWCPEQGRDVTSVAFEVRRSGWARTWRRTLRAGELTTSMGHSWVRFEGLDLSVAVERSAETDDLFEECAAAVQRANDRRFGTY